MNSEMYRHLQRKAFPWNSYSGENVKQFKKLKKKAWHPEVKLIICLFFCQFFKLIWFWPISAARLSRWSSTKWVNRYKILKAGLTSVSRSHFSVCVLVITQTSTFVQGWVQSLDKLWGNHTHHTTSGQDLNLWPSDNKTKSLITRPQERKKKKCWILVYKTYLKSKKKETLTFIQVQFRLKSSRAEPQTSSVFTAGSKNPM